MKKFSREQLVFIVATMLGSIPNMALDIFPSKLKNGKRDRTWEEQRKEVTVDPVEFVKTHLSHLGWNLSVLYAQITNDGMGVCDAIAIVNVGEEITKYVQKFADGTIGTIPGENNLGTIQGFDPNDQLATQWVDEVFEDYLNN